jgi:hypothetical protein
MSTWKIGDTTVKSGGECDDKETERRLKKGIEFYSFGPEPDGRWPVDVSNDWTIHQWATEQARIASVELETDYAESEDDIPDDVAEYVRQAESAKFDKSVRY